jgi:amino acid transporter
MKTPSQIVVSAAHTADRALFGKRKDPNESGIFHRLSLIAFFAWVGLGADGLSSSCYGPEEAYLALHGHTFLALFLALGTALTVAVIAASYTQIIELFPGGGGGYLVASRLLSPEVGVVSGCALVVDYVLTIAVSVASGVDALLSFTSHADSPYKTMLCLLVILGLLMLNLRGIKESINALLPIFLLFVITHAILILGTFFQHVGNAPAIVRDSFVGTRDSIRTEGFWVTLFLFLRAYSMGAGTYTGIEAVSNGLPVLREPRVRTGKRTMLYMAISLAITAAGILFGYQMFGIGHETGRTLNASLLHRFADGWNGGALPLGSAFVALALLAEGALLFVAAQTGFVDGPRIMASMAVDRWVPSRFANLSSRLVTANGVMLMAAAAAAALIYTHAQTKHLIIMYAINVFLTFSLSQLGMVRHWWQERHAARGWLWRMLLNGSGLVISVTILAVTVALKFFQGGWVTVALTGTAVLVAFAIRNHYKRFQFASGMLNLLVQDTMVEQDEETPQPVRREVALFVNRYDGLGLHSLSGIRSLFGKDLTRLTFLSVVQVGSDQFRNEKHIAQLRAAREQDLQRYEAMARSWGVETESHYALGTDVVEELEKLAVGVATDRPDTLFVAGQVVFQRETFTRRLLHNDVAFNLQRRLVYRSLNVLVLPVTLPPEAL